MSSNYPQATAERAEELVENYERILSQVTATANVRPVRLVAVSKLKPSSDIMALYNHGVRHFGENYVQELISKAQELPKDIHWHFIGGLQSNKCKDLSKNISNLYATETIDSLKKAKKLQETRQQTDFDAINVYLQINTSGEDQKSGLSELSEIFELVEYLKSDESTKLNLEGLMTIGSFETSISSDEQNKDFAKLVEIKTEIEKKYELKGLELSMGMSSDFQQAIKQGSTSVRVGSDIFGVRPPRNGH